MSHLFLIFGSFYLVITNIGVILRHNLKTEDMKKLLLLIVNVITLGLGCFTLENGGVTWISLVTIILSSINILVLCQEKEKY